MNAETPSKEQVCIVAKASFEDFQQYILLLRLNLKLKLLNTILCESGARDKPPQFKKVTFLPFVVGR